MRKRLREEFRCPEKEEQNERSGQGQTVRVDDGQVGEDQGSKSEGGKAEKIIIGYPNVRAGRRFGGRLFKPLCVSSD